MNFDMLKYRYPSRRSVICGRRGMVCTSQPLAAQAGLDILKKGGNAVDAAIATAVCMTVLEPTSNGLGSDAFDLLWFNGKLYGLNGSGGAPKLQKRCKTGDTKTCPIGVGTPSPFREPCRRGVRCTVASDDCPLKSFSPPPLTTPKMDFPSIP